MRRMLTPALMMAALTAASLAHGAGFAIYEWSPAHNATAGTLLGNPKNADAAWLNPAGMTLLPDTCLQGGASWITRDSNTSIYGVHTSMKRQQFLIPGLYATQQLDNRWWLGFATTTEYGMGTKYPKTLGWNGRWSNLETDITSVTVSPTVAFAATEWLSLGAGPRIMWLDFYNRRDVGVPFQMEGDGWGIGYTASALVKIGELVGAKDAINFGIVYRSEVKQELKGSAQSLALVQKGLPYNSYAEGRLHMPASTVAGVNWQATEKLNLGTSLMYTEWSNYDELFIKFNHFGTPDQKKWKDVWRAGVGASYAVTDELTLMCGYAWDQDPINSKHADYMLPPGNRHLGNLGLAYALTKNLEISAGYTYIYMENRFMVVNAPTGQQLPSKVTDSNAHIVSSAIAYKF